MSNQTTPKPTARNGLTIISFLIVIIGQAYILRGFRPGNIPAELRLPLTLELIFCFFMAIGCIICCLKPMGWTVRAGCLTALFLFFLYAFINIVFYPAFSSAYLTGIQTAYASVGGGLVGLKLVFSLIGVTAGIPVSAPIDKREYADRLRRKVQDQDAQWAQASAENAKKELEKIISNAENTSPYPPSHQEVSSQAVTTQPTSSHPSKQEEQKEETISEQWRGWGCG
ncbi:hypothetical protein AALB16_07130 [Lachnospiraceae bacterium 62-35]